VSTLPVDKAKLFEKCFSSCLLSNLFLFLPSFYHSFSCFSVSVFLSSSFFFSFLSSSSTTFYGEEVVELGADEIKRISHLNTNEQSVTDKPLLTAIQFLLDAHIRFHSRSSEEKSCLTTNQKSSLKGAFEK